MLDLEIISLDTPGLSDYTKRLIFLEKRPVLTELFLHRKHTVQKIVKFPGLTSVAEQTQSDFQMELL